jgi:hypothetical protein
MPEKPAFYVPEGFFNKTWVFPSLKTFKNRAGKDKLSWQYEFKQKFKINVLTIVLFLIKQKLVWRSSDRSTSCVTSFMVEHLHFYFNFHVLRASASCCILLHNKNIHTEPEGECETDRVLCRGRAR